MKLATNIGLTAVCLSMIGATAGAEDSVPATLPLSHRSAFAALLGGGPPGTFYPDPIPLDEGRLSNLVGGFVGGALKIDVELSCMAKVVYHEARDRDLLAQLAVAEVVENRARTEGFPKTVCSVVNQPGQFFPTKGYSAPTASSQWRTAVAIARIAEQRTLPSVTSGALFYHAASVAPPWRRDHQKVAEVGGNIFYR